MVLIPMWLGGCSGSLSVFGKRAVDYGVNVGLFQGMVFACGFRRGLRGRGLLVFTWRGRMVPESLGSTTKFLGCRGPGKGA